MTLSPTGSLPVEPLFARGAQGNLLLVEHLPDPALDKRHAVYFLPPFAEEMNKTRRMFSLQAQRLAGYGYRAIVFDLYGTGDSEGDFSEARWDIWLDDITALCDRHRQHGVEKHSFIAARTGALLAVEHCGRQAASKLVLWQPCTSGKAYLRQFLRLRLAAGLTGDTQNKETAGDLMQRLEQGESLEIAGYELTSELALRIEKLDLIRAQTACLPSVHWLDLVANNAVPLSVASNKVINHWRESGVAITAAPVPGEPFWSVQEMTIAPQLLDATTALFAAEA